MAARDSKKTNSVTTLLIDALGRGIRLPSVCPATQNLFGLPFASQCGEDPRNQIFRDCPLEMKLPIAILPAFSSFQSVYAIPTAA